MFFKIFKYDVKKYQGSAKRTKLSAPKFRVRCNPSKGEIAITGKPIVGSQFKILARQLLGYEHPFG